MNEQTTSEETKVNPDVTGNEVKSEPSGETNTENKTKSTGYASEPEGEKHDWEKRYKDSSREVSRWKKEADELRAYKAKMDELDQLSSKDPRILEWIEEAKAGKTPQTVESVNTPRGYDKVVQSLLKDEIKSIESEIETEFSEVINNPQTSKKMLEYTRKNIIQSDGVYLDARTQEPISPSEYREILRQGAILAGNYYQESRSEYDNKSFAQKKLNELGTTARIPVASGSKDTVEIPVDIMASFKKLGVTDAEMPSYAKAWREKNK